MSENGQELNCFISILRQHMPELVEKYKVSSLGVFGSYVRGEQRKDSDLDLLVEFYKTPDLFEFMDLEEHLSELLGVEVELVTHGSLRGNIGRRILDEAIHL